MVIKNKWERKSLIGLEELSEEEINLLLDKAKYFKKLKSLNQKIPESLAGKRIVNLFLEPSTRTRIAFEVAAKALMQI